MDLPGECAAEPPAAEPPSGRLNKAAFKLFRRRKAGGAMPSIFGVRNKGDGKGAGAAAGLARSRTHDGLAELAVLEGGRREEPRPGAPRDPAGPVAKSHSFLSLLRRSGRAEPGSAEPAGAGPAAGRQKRGLRGLLSGMRWPRKDKRAREAAAAVAAVAGAPGRGPPGSLSASLECVQEEPAPPATPSQDAPDPAGCGDIIADPDEEAGPSCDKHGPGPGKPVLSPKPPGVVAYQGGGEEMASPDGVDDTCLQDFWDMLSQAEDRGPGSPEGEAVQATAAPEPKGPPESGRDARCAEVVKDTSSVKRRRLHRIPIELPPKEEPKPSGKEPPEGVPNSDEGYWDSTTPGPEEEGSSNGGKKGSLPRDSCSGDLLYDLDSDPDASPAAPPAGEDTPPCQSRLKPVSPVSITCPLRTPGSLLKDSKIPISIKHLAHLPVSQPAVSQPPARSEVPKTKIPVSKVLVRRVSSRGLAGTTLRAAACHEGAKKL
ncbi:APC membrane recruitment protein 2 [Erinaceus europaeus]|uniref:APC membrane recruitment protein 2 n=1 Tax=Erinaceus europaeus TaxID=9365 RepID=A0ABM3XPD3_ERIEU|nr:APC membrane recruitment protein 2 [Erinaceus europaeus]